MKPSREARQNKLLVVRCQLGEAEAFDELVELWHPRLGRYVARLLTDEDAAKEVLQETWLRILRGIPRLQEPGRLAPWMHRIAHNVVMDRLRGKYSRAVSVDLDLDQLEGETSLTSMDENLAELRRGLLALPLVERDVLTLFYLQELALSEVAEVLGIPIGTVKSRLYRARCMLRKVLKAATDSPISQVKGVHP